MPITRFSSDLSSTFCTPLLQVVDKQEDPSAFLILKSEKIGFVLHFCYKTELSLE
jgi:hypothetical protein